jgi:serine protease inhibitor
MRIESDARPQPFKLVDGSTVNVDTMYATTKHLTGDPVRVAWNDSYEAICLKTDGPVDVWVAVPTGDLTPEDIVKTLAGGNGISDLYENAESSGELEPYMPRFDFTYTGTSLESHLQSMGIHRLFDPSAQLQGIATVPPPFYVTSIVQCAHIEVDEKGVEAQAASGAQSGCGAALSRVLRVDRPFLVVLAESASHAPLFCAIIRDPRLN